MNSSSNKYTLILIKDYANLNQIKLSPTSFWTFVSCAILFSLVSLFAIVAALFLWFTSKNMIVEHKELQQKYAQAQISLERLLVLEKIVSQNTTKENTSSAKLDGLFPAENSQENVNSNKEIVISTPEKVVAEKKIETVKQKEFTTGKKQFKQKVLIASSMFTITQAKIVASQDAFLYEARLNNNIRKQKSGSLVYYITTKNGKRYNVPAQRIARTYSFLAYKTIITELPYPNGINANTIVSLGVEVLENKTVSYKIEYVF